GYASGTVPGAITRRYHGLLIAALGAPLGRTVMLSHVAEQVRFPDGRRVEIEGRERSGASADAHGAGYLIQFRLESGLPVWRYAVDDIVVEKRLFMPHMQNTVDVVYELVEGGAAGRIELVLRPSVNFRPQEKPVSEPLGAPYEFRSVGDEHEIIHPGGALPPLRMKLWTDDADEGSFVLKGKRLDNVLYPVEERRGYQARGGL